MKRVIKSGNNCLQFLYEVRFHYGSQFPSSFFATSESFTPSSTVYIKKSHWVILRARIPLTLSQHPSLSSIALANLFRVITEMMNRTKARLCLGGPQENVTNELIHTSISGSVWLIVFGSFARWVVGGRAAYILQNLLAFWTEKISHIKI